MSKTITKKIHTDKFLTVFFVDINNIHPDSYADGTNKQREYADDFVVRISIAFSLR